MFEVSIHAGRRVYRRSLPVSWKEAPANLRLAWWKLWIEDPDAAPLRILPDCLRLPKRVWRNLPAAEKGALLKCLDWMEPAPGCDNLPVEHFRHRGRHYLLPRPKFENGTCLEFVLADGYYEDFVETGDPAALLRIVATLCREPKTDLQEALKTGDERVTLHQKEEVEYRAQQLSTLDPAITSAVLLYFLGVKKYIADTYWMLFEDTKKQEDGGDQESDGSGPRFGWWSIFMQVAKDRLYGSYDDVLQHRLHKICVHLVEQHDQQEKQKQALERERAKLNSQS
ncbi:MAG: hypothetical protein JNM22_05680 [Saprospiraceae bacterium]|nr:hypothetical protein [Saprospiraceae bacterium]